LSGLFLVALVGVAILAPVIAPYDPNATAPLERLQAPSIWHLMGTDDVGRDVFSRVVYGTRVSLYAGILGTALGVIVGSAIGILSGYFRGAPDFIFSRIIDALLAIPALVLMLVLVTVIGSGINTVALAIGVAFAPVTSRIVRGSVLPLSTETWVIAARSTGCSERRILWRYIVPNVMAPIIVVASISLGAAILAEAGISFLGYGVKPPTASWGQMLSSGGRINQEQAPWLAIFPGLAIGCTVLAANLFGDAVRDALDPRLRGR
jgi:ABC-type dipeptide/oligopeptide/nickel transport system permease subunit